MTYCKHSTLNHYDQLFMILSIFHYHLFILTLRLADFLFNMLTGPIRTFHEDHLTHNTAKP